MVPDSGASRSKSTSQACHSQLCPALPTLVHQQHGHPQWYHFPPHPRGCRSCHQCTTCIPDKASRQLVQTEKHVQFSTFMERLKPWPRLPGCPRVVSPPPLPSSVRQLPLPGPPAVQATPRQLDFSAPPASPAPRVLTKPRQPDVLPLLPPQLSLPIRKPISHCTRSQAQATLVLFASCRSYHEQVKYHMPTAKALQPAEEPLAFAVFCAAINMNPAEVEGFAYLCKALT